MNSQENQNEETETLDFTKPDYTFIPQGNHQYRQAGYYLICKSCEMQHAVWIGSRVIMVGVDDKGQPILKTRKSLGMG